MAAEEHAPEASQESSPDVIAPRTPEDKVSGRALALIPFGVAALFIALTMPRSAPPDVLPLPIPDMRALGRTMDEDHARAELAKKSALPFEVRALGSALREFNRLQVEGADAVAMHRARGKIDEARVAALPLGVEPLLQLRAAQLETFLAELKTFERSGTQSDELRDTGGTFISRGRDVGWIEGNRIKLSETERRVLFKGAWVAAAGFEDRREFAPQIDELRALYTIYLTRPHLRESDRHAVESLRRGAKDAQACARAADRERIALEQWRLDKVRKLGSVDPAYPLQYAVGVLHYRLGNYPAATESFRDWLSAHPDGPWTVRAKNHLKGSITTDIEGS